jgi:uncharacterized protein (TIGR02266 family)
MSRDNRNFTRTPLSMKIRLTESGDDISIKFDISNLSEGGVFVKSSILWEPDQEFDLSFTLPGQEKEIKAKGKVARSEDSYSIFVPQESDSSIPGMGIKFIEISDEDKALIKEFIESMN